MSAHDEALVTELAELAAASLGWDWRTEDIGDMRYPSGPETIRPEIEVILDRLLELGWRPPTRPAVTVYRIGWHNRHRPWWCAWRRPWQAESEDVRWARRALTSGGAQRKAERDAARWPRLTFHQWRKRFGLTQIAPRVCATIGHKPFTTSLTADRPTWCLRCRVNPARDEPGGLP